MERKAAEVRETERYHIRAILRALDVLEAFTPSRPTLSLTEVSEIIGLNASTTFRLLITLQNRGYIEQDPTTGRYRIGVASLKPSSTFLAHLNVRERVYPFLVQLRDETRETVHLTILDHLTMQVIYLEKLEGLQPIGLMSSRVGGRCPAHCTGVGKALLAYYDQSAVEAFFANAGLQRYTPNTITTIDGLMRELEIIRRRGYSVDNAEHEPGVMCVAVPIRDHLGVVVAALSVSGPSERISQVIENGGLIERTLRAGRSASQQLGYNGGERAY